MQKLQLYIEGNRIDMFKDETVSITQTINNIKDVAKVFTSFTKTFSVPASSNNNKLFKHYYNYDISDGFDARLKKTSTIELNNIPYKIGRIRLDGVDLKNNSPHTYKVTFFGNTVELTDILGDDKLGSLLFASTDYDLVYKESNLKLYLGSVVNTGKIIVPLITHTDRLYYNSAQNTASTFNLEYDASYVRGVKPFQLKYAIRLYELILEIEAKYTIANGYANNIVFSRDFLSTSNATFYNLYMWLHRKSGDVQAPAQVTNYTTIVPGYTQSGGTSFIVLSGQNIIIPSTLVTFPNNILSNDLTITPSSGYTSINYQVAISLNGTIIYTSAEGSGTRNFTNVITPVANGVYNVSLIHQDVINFGVVWEWSGSINPPDQTSIPYTEIFTRTSVTGATDFDFIVSEQIPDVTIISFLSGLFKMFNLVAYVNDSNVIVVRPLEAASGINYSYLTSADIDGNDAPVNYDISKYIDVSKSQVNVALPYKEIKYKFEGTGTYLAKQHNQLAGEDWGNLSYKGGTNAQGSGGLNYNAATQIYEVLVPFEHMKYERLLDASNGNDTTIQWGYSVNENEQPYIGQPVIFYGIRQTGGTAISIWNSNNTVTQSNVYWIPSNSRALATATSTENINFNYELNEYTGSLGFTGTLFANYHSEYIIDVFNTSRRLTKLDAFLPLRILYNFKLNDTFTINQRTYIINSITTNLNNGKSSMELLNRV